VNQAIGRVIRHVQDYGSIVLIDERYTWQTNRSQISKWLRDRIKVYSSPEDLGSAMETFFAEMKGRKFIPKVE
jgi:regulator of telomere elongation helicase 1